MEASPLTQQSRPDSFQPKIVQLYKKLFKGDDDVEKSDGFWQEFFLLKPDSAGLKEILDPMSPDELLHHQVRPRREILSTGCQNSDYEQDRPQEFVAQAISRIQTGSAPSDEIALDVSRPSTLSTSPRATADVPKAKAAHHPQPRP